MNVGDDGLVFHYKIWLRSMRCHTNTSISKNVFLVDDIKKEVSRLADPIEIDKGRMRVHFLQQTDLDEVKSLTFVPVIAVYLDLGDRHAISIFLYRENPQAKWTAFCCNPNHPGEKTSIKKVQEISRAVLHRKVDVVREECVNVNEMPLRMFHRETGICLWTLGLNLLAAQFAFANKRIESPIVDAEMIIELIREGSSVFRKYPDLVLLLLRDNQPLAAWHRLFGPGPQQRPRAYFEPARRRSRSRGRGSRQPAPPVEPRRWAAGLLRGLDSGVPDTLEF